MDDRTRRSGRAPARHLGTALAAVVGALAIGCGGGGDGTTTAPRADGDLAIALTWQADVDLDVHVVAPSGDELTATGLISAGGGFLENDDTGGVGPNVETVLFPEPPPLGPYVAFAELMGPPPADDVTIPAELVFTLGADRLRRETVALPDAGDTFSRRVTVVLDASMMP